MTDHEGTSTIGSSTERGAAGEQTTRLRAELAARRAASEIVAEANRLSDRAAAEAESMVAEAESLAAELVEEARQRADAIVARARAEAESLGDVAAAERAEMAELRTKVEALLSQIGGGLGDLGALLLTGTRSEAVVASRSWDDLEAQADADAEAHAQPEPAPRIRESSLYAVASLPNHDRTMGVREDDGADDRADDRADDEVDSDPGTPTETEPVPGREFDRVIEAETEADRSDDLEDAGNDPRPLGWLFRGH